MLTDQLINNSFVLIFYRSFVSYFQNSSIFIDRFNLQILSHESNVIFVLVKNYVKCTSMKFLIEKGCEIHDCLTETGIKLFTKNAIYFFLFNIIDNALNHELLPILYINSRMSRFKFNRVIQNKINWPFLIEFSRLKPSSFTNTQIFLKKIKFIDNAA